MATTNRTVSFVSHLELILNGGKVLPHAVALGDVDNDAGNELAVGTTEGCLYVFRGHCTTPCCLIPELGTITCITVGDVMQEKKNSIIVLNTEGMCYIYNISLTKDVGNDSVRSSSNPEEKEQCGFHVDMRHKQHLPTNAEMLLLGDVDGDGQQELIISHTDRMVYSYRWDSSSDMLVGLQQWKLRQSVGSITLHNGSDSGQPQIIASQPGCAYATLHPVWSLDGNDSGKSELSKDHLSYNPMSSLSRSQNPAISCQIVGNICKGSEGQKGYFALCTLDGNIKLIDDQVMWSLQVDHQLFAINKLDVLGNRKEEVILCAWDGLTYIVDHDRNVVRFQFEENVQAFCAGQYAIEDGENVVCLVYVDFWNKMKLYYDIQLPRLMMTDFLTEVDSDPEIKELLSELGAKTEKEKIDMIRYCMYGIPSRSREEEKSSGKIELLSQVYFFIFFVYIFFICVLVLQYMHTLYFSENDNYGY